MDGPFVVFKQPGLSREGGSEGTTEYTTTQYIDVENSWASLPPPAPPPENTREP